MQVQTFFPIFAFSIQYLINMQESTIKLTDYDVAEVIDTFGIHKKIRCQQLQDWCKATGTLKPYKASFLEDVRLHLERDWDSWNEEELKMHFISTVFITAEIDVEAHIKTFYERPMKGEVNGVEISVICDCMVATSKLSGNPQVPYFFLQEFAPHLPPKLGGGWGEGDRNDPEAQMLVAMLLAQQANADGKPLYGAWLQGENWYFTVLNGLEYCRSKIYVATNRTQLEQIVYMLQYVKIVALTVNS